MEVLSLLSKMCRVIKRDSESTRSSRAQDCETVRHVLAAHERCVKAVKASYSSIFFLKIYMKYHMNKKLLGEIYQLNHWKELNLRRQSLSLLTSAQSGKHRQLLIKQPKDDISTQLKELVINDMLIALFPCLNKLATICLSVPISTASVEQSFSNIKLINNRLRNCLTELSLSKLVKIVIESPEKLTDSDLEESLTCGIEKVDRLLCKLSFRLLFHYICSHCSCTLSSTYQHQ